MNILGRWKSNLSSYSYNYITSEMVKLELSSMDTEQVEIEQNVSDLMVEENDDGDKFQDAETFNSVIPQLSIVPLQQSVFDLSNVKNELDLITGSGRDVILDFNTKYDQALEMKDRVMFPYLEYAFTKKYIYELMEQLRTNADIVIDNVSRPKYFFTQSENDLKFDGQYHNILVGRNEYQYDKLKKYFNEGAIINCRCNTSEKTLTPMEYFETEYDNIVKYFRKNGFGLTPISVNAYIYSNIQNVCSSFRPKVMNHLIKMFNVKTVLDPSCGWGDRLIGCYSTNVEEYYGYDPNINLAEGYQKIIEHYGSDETYQGYQKVIEYKANDINCNIEFIPFETATPPTNHFDLAMLCPPDYNREQYVEDESDELQYQSSFGLSERQWYDTKLSVWIQKCYESLIDNGVLCVNVKSRPDMTYVKWLLDDMKRNRLWRRLGTLNYIATDPKEANEPIFVWEKIGKKEEQKSIGSKQSYNRK